jgi:hypothetical protein
MPGTAIVFMYSAYNLYCFIAFDAYSDQPLTAQQSSKFIIIIEKCEAMMDTMYYTLSIMALVDEIKGLFAWLVEYS